VRISDAAEDQSPIGLTLPLSGEAAVASAKTADRTTDEHHGEPASGFVRFNGGLDTFALFAGGMGRHSAAAGERIGNGEGSGA